MAAMSQDSDFDSDDDEDDADFNFDTVAQQAVSAMQSSGAASSSSSRELRELGLNVGLSAEQLYLTGSGPGQAAFDTSAPPGVCSLDARDFISSAGSAVPEARMGSREVRGAPV